MATERWPGWKLGLFNIWQRRLLALDAPNGRLLTWHNMSGTESGSPIDLFAVDAAELSDGPLSGAPSGVAGTLTIRVRDGRSG